MHDVSYHDFIQGKSVYEEVYQKLPDHIRKYLPQEYDEFLHDLPKFLGWYHNRDSVRMGDTAYGKLKMLLSPHATSLLYAWVNKHHPVNANTS